MDLSSDDDGDNMVAVELSRKVRSELVSDARREGTIPALSAMYIKALADLGYDKFHDDVTILMFGAYDPPPDAYEAAVRVSSDDVDAAAQRLAEWCRGQGWPEDGISRVQLVFEEKLMNIHDHGFDDREKLREVVSVRLKRILDSAVLTIWDGGTAEPSIAVVAGDSGTAFEMANRNMAGRGRGRLIVRELCDGVERNCYPPLNETTYHIPLFGKKAGGGKTGEGK